MVPYGRGVGIEPMAICTRPKSLQRIRIHLFVLCTFDNQLLHGAESTYTWTTRRELLRYTCTVLCSVVRKTANGRHSYGSVTATETVTVAATATYDMTYIGQGQEDLGANGRKWRAAYGGEGKSYTRRRGEHGRSVCIFVTDPRRWRWWFVCGVVVWYGTYR